jgi:hypothetical protein
MVFADYYAESVTESVAYNVGKGTRNVVTVVQAFSPIKAIGAVTVVWGAVTAVVNYRKYRKGMLTGKQAITITASESVGMGISAGMGLLADGVFLATAAPSVLAFTLGVVVTSGAKIAWNCATKNNMIWCQHQTPKKEQEKGLRTCAA